MNTKTKLVKELMKKPESPMRDDLVHYAKNGWFHDFESHLALPKISLVQGLEEAGYTDLADRAKRGEYD